MARKTRPPEIEENSIEPALAPARQLPLGAMERETSKTNAPSLQGAASAAAAGSASTSPADSRDVPSAVRERFLQVGEKFFFPTGDPAFRDQGRKLTTRRENAEVVRSLIEIAQARGWNEINVSGTTAFRRSVWQEASLANLTVKGFTPKDIDEAQLVRRMARRAQAGESASARSDSSAEADKSHESRPTESPREAPARARKSASKVTIGKLMAHGAENYRLDPHADMSYFITLKTDDNRSVTLWGLDLERALKESKSQPAIGDRVGVVSQGKMWVTVMKREHDDNGRLIGEHPVQTHRNDWTIEKQSFFEKRAQLAAVVGDSSIDARNAVERNPELAGTYVALKGAELRAQRDFADQHDRQRFVDMMRRTLAREIRRGDALYAPAMRDRPKAAEHRAHPPAAPEMTPLR